MVVPQQPEHMLFLLEGRYIAYYDNRSIPSNINIYIVLAVILKLENWQNNR